MRIALITGASSGIGAEFARRIDRTEKGMDEIWLLARRKQRLEETAGSLHHAARVVQMDLTDRTCFETLDQMFQEAGVRVGLLVNCAGYGIIQICSTAAFQPLQHVNIYSATKAFLYHYTRALRMELLPRKISVLAVCPYWVKDTEFIGIAEKGKVAAAGRKDMPIRHYTFATTADRVVRSALRCSRMGLAVCTPGAVCTLDRIFAKILPREAMLYIWEAFRRI